MSLKSYTFLITLYSLHLTLDREILFAVDGEFYLVEQFVLAVVDVVDVNFECKVQMFTVAALLVAVQPVGGDARLVEVCHSISRKVFFRGEKK